MDIAVKLQQYGVPADLLMRVAYLERLERDVLARREKDRERKKFRGIPRTSAESVQKTNEINGANINNSAEIEKERRERSPPITPSKEKKEREEYIYAKFDEFWSVYPRRVAKLAALRAFKKALSRVSDPSVLVESARRYGEASRDKEAEYVKHPSTWLNGGCWDDGAELQTQGTENERRLREEAKQIAIEYERRRAEHERQRGECERRRADHEGELLGNSSGLRKANGVKNHANDIPWLRSVG